MPEVSSLEAAQIVGVSDETIRHDVTIGDLPAKRIGKRKIIRIDIDNLRSYAVKFNRIFDQSVADQLVAKN